MQISRLIVRNFRVIKAARIILPKHSVLIGDNNTGKTTLLEAIDLVLGPDRLNRFPPIDEHDFYQGQYIADTLADDVRHGDEAARAVEAESTDATDGKGQSDDKPSAVSPKVEIEVTIVDLTEEHKGRFGDYIEFWDKSTDKFYDEADPAGVDGDLITEALRVTFMGHYDPEEDDFEGKTWFARSLSESDRPDGFSKKDKQICGFLYLRSLRTGSRAVSLERGSLLDIILRLKEVRPRMWEETISQLRALSIATDPKLGISSVLQSINAALRKYVPKEMGDSTASKGLESDAGPSAERDHRVHCHGRGQPRSAVLSARKGDDKHAGAGDAVGDRPGQAKRHLRDGGARNCDTAVCAKAYRSRNPRTGLTDDFHLPFSVRA
jgi:putative ATP-dependent endonuclease of OLD family